MDDYDEQGTPHRHCPTCGADVAAEARFCGVCGADMLAEQAPASASSEETPGEASPDAVDVTDSPADSASHAETSHAGATQADGKLCDWCGAYSPQGAARCVSCGAVFPTPEGDMALEHAAMQRIKAMEGDLQRQRKGGWWPFRSR